MRSVESEGTTIDEAIENALRLLRLERDAVEIEILENATKGLLGFGTRKARVRARERTKVEVTLEATDEAAGVKPEIPATPARADAPRVSWETRPAPKATPRVGKADSGEAHPAISATLGEILRLMGVECEIDVAVDPSGEATILSVSGPDGGIVIGRRGQTLDALEHLMNRISMRDSSVMPTRIRIDVEGYRERRQESLEQLARRLADKARETGRVVTLNPMSPRDRRVIHLTLQGDPEVTTWSQGEGQFRRLLIGPRDDHRQLRDRDGR